MEKYGGKVIRVNFGGILRDFTGRTEVDITLAEASTLADLMRRLAEIIGPEAVGRGREYQWRHGFDYVLAVVDGRAFDPGRWEEFSPQDGCVVHLVPPLSGG